MKAKKRKSKSINKGAPSGLIASILIHAGAFVLAGVLVVFTVVNKEEKTFEPPKPVDRPRMKLKKPQVKVKKNAKPKSSSRIVTKVQKASMPDIQLPEMSGLGDGLIGDGIGGGFDLKPALEDVTLFGGSQSIGSDFEGTFYDLKRRRDGGLLVMDDEKFYATLAKFTRSGFKSSTLAMYYRSPKKLYATNFLIPTIHSNEAPKAFGEPDCGGWQWFAHYEGQLVFPEPITFRFWGQGDEILMVQVDGEIVLNAGWPGYCDRYCNWTSTGGNSRQYRLGNNYAVPSDWITLEPGKPIDMDVITGDGKGGHYDCMLCIEVEGVEYPRNSQPGPIFPMFKTAEPSFDQKDAIYEWLVDGHASLTNGPVFCDFESGASQKVRTEEVASTPAPSTPPQKPLARYWSLTNGKTLEATYVSVIGDKLILNNPEGKQIRIKLNDISDEDKRFIKLSNPPTFEIDYIKRSQTILSRYKMSPAEMEWGKDSMRVLDFIFGARVRQRGAGAYPYELNVEYFAVGQQYLDDDKFILFDRGDRSFIPSKENRRSMEFVGEKPVESISYTMKGQIRGKKNKGHLILIRDERGIIIEHSASPEWLYDIREELADIPVGRFFDETGQRVHPTGPDPHDDI